MTWKTIATAAVVGFVGGFGKYYGEIAAGQFQLWMLVPITGFGIIAVVVFLFGQFLWNLYKSNRDLTVTVATLEKKLTGKKDRKDQALEALRSQVFGEIRQIKTDLLALRTDMRRESQSYKEKKTKLVDTIVTQRWKPNPIELAEAVKPTVPVPTELPLNSETYKGLGLGPKEPGLGLAPKTKDMEEYLDATKKLGEAVTKALKNQN